MATRPDAWGIGWLNQPFLPMGRPAKKVAKPIETGPLGLFPGPDMAIRLSTEGRLGAEGVELPKLAPISQRSKRFWADFHFYVFDAGGVPNGCCSRRASRIMTVSKHFACQAFFGFKTCRLHGELTTSHIEPFIDEECFRLAGYRGPIAKLRIWRARYGSSFSVPWPWR